jgi:transposase
MSQKPIAMEQLKQILQLKQDGVGIRETARRTGMSRNSVRKYLALLDAGGTDESEALSNKELADKAYRNDQLEHDADRLQQLHKHFAYAESELSRTGVTRQLLWKEYIDQHPDGYVYSHYCYHFSQYLRHKDLSMHMEYQAGDLVMIDFAGKKQHYIDQSTGERVECEVFVSVLPFSGMIFCLGVPSQQTVDFVTCINAMLRYYAGVPATILCDNLKTAVVRPCRYEPVFTEICNQLSEHYQSTFSATRPYSPRDKGMVENAVSIVYAHVYAPLRNREFDSLQALNTAMHEQLLLLNNKPYKNTVYSRWYYYEQKERPTLKLLPAEPFAPKKVVVLTVQRNYHVQLREDCFYYSVPYQYVGKKVKVLYDKRVVEVYYDNSRIAVHIKKPNSKAYTTLADHMPPHHQRMQQIKGWNKEDLLNQASRIGQAALQAATLMLDNSIFIEQNYKACFGMLMLQNKYGQQRLEAACSRALMGTRVNYTMIRNILEKGLDKQSTSIDNPATIPNHENIRGKDHYQ